MESYEISLSPDTVLQLAPNFRTRLDAAGHVIVDSPAGTIVDIGPRGFAIFGAGAARSTRSGSTVRTEVTGWQPSSWPKPRPRRGAADAGWSWVSPMTC